MGCMHGRESTIVDTYMRGRSRGESGAWIEHPGDTDNARRGVLLRVTVVYIDRTKPPFTGFSSFFVNHMCGTGPLGQNKLTAHVAFNDNLERVNHCEAV